MTSEQRVVVMFVVACNVVLRADHGSFTLTNYGQRNNCTVSVISPASIQIDSVAVTTNRRTTVALQQAIHWKVPTVICMGDIGLRISFHNYVCASTCKIQLHCVRSQGAPWIYFVWLTWLCEQYSDVSQQSVTLFLLKETAQNQQLNRETNLIMTIADSVIYSSVVYRCVDRQYSTECKGDI